MQSIITGSEIYWITRLDGINFVFGVGLFLSSMVAVVALIAGIIAKANDDEDTAKIAERILCYLVPIVLFSMIGLVFTPTTKQMCAIKVIPMVANNEKVQELPEKVVDLADEWLEELRSKYKE